MYLFVVYIYAYKDSGKLTRHFLLCISVHIKIQSNLHVTFLCISVHIKIQNNLHVTFCCVYMCI